MQSAFLALAILMLAPPIVYFLVFAARMGYLRATRRFQDAENK